MKVTRLILGASPFGYRARARHGQGPYLLARETVTGLFECSAFVPYHFLPRFSVLSTDLAWSQKRVMRKDRWTR